jgi:hypothetical protein
MNWVYSVGTEKPIRFTEEIKLKPRFFSRLRLGSSTPQRAPSPLPQPATNEAEYLKVGRSKVVLTILTADVDVKIDQKLSTEFYRATKKDPPRELKYKLIYVGRSLFTPAIKDADVGFRRERMSTMRARERMTLSPRQRAVFSRTCAQTWMGERDFRPFVFLLTLAQVWFRSHIHRQSCDKCNKIIAHLG